MSSILTNEDEDKNVRIRVNNVSKIQRFKVQETFSKKQVIHFSYITGYPLGRNGK